MRKSSPRAFWSLVLAWVFVLAVGASDALAFCTPVMAALGVRLRATPIAFIGVVERVEGGVAHVTVEKAIRGQPESPVPMLDSYAGYDSACRERLGAPGRFSVGERLIVFGLPRTGEPLDGEPETRLGERRPLYSGGLEGGAVFHFTSDGVRMEDAEEGLLFETATFLDFAEGQVPLTDAALGAQAKELGQYLDDPLFEPVEESSTSPPELEPPRGCTVGGGSGWCLLLLPLLILPASSIGRPRRTRA